MTDMLLSVKGLTVHFGKKGSLLSAGSPIVHAVDGISFDVERGTTFGIVGESGSGKTTAALAIMRLVQLTAGTVELDSTEISGLEGEDLRLARKDFQIVFQDPFSSLNPRRRAGRIVREPLDFLGDMPEEEKERAVEKAIAAVGLRPESKNFFPHQFSGGQRQRIGLARALVTNPKLVVLDEAVSALDVAIQAQILNLFARLQDEFGLTYLFISHDLGVIRHACDRVAVMYLGQFVEVADRDDLFNNPRHPYTRALLDAVPSMSAVSSDRKKAHRPLHGDPPSPIDLPLGCRFAGRCPLAEDICHSSPPKTTRCSANHLVACHLVSDP